MKEMALQNCKNKNEHNKVRPCFFHDIKEEVTTQKDVPIRLFFSSFFAWFGTGLSASHHDVILYVFLMQVYQQTHEATELLKRTREEKARLEEELMTIKRKSGVHDALRKRLSDSEVLLSCTGRTCLGS